MNFENLNKKIIKCNKCPRLINFIKEISIKKRKKNIKETYWSKPVPGFGDNNAKIMIMGLAPAAHGGNRTGRAFTGDKSGEFLFKCLHKVNLSNQLISNHINDDLKLNYVYITNILKCVPPGDKPLKEELNNCSIYFENEIKNLKKLKVIITLGKVAFDNCLKFYNKIYKKDKKIIFKHENTYLLPDNIFLICCYHPSPRNFNRKIITSSMMIALLKKAKKLARF